MPNPLQQLHAFGQSFWYDNIRRELLTGGELARMVREDGLRGLTSNPTIFAKAVAGSSDYDATLRRYLGRTPEDSFLELAMEDIRAACGVLRPVYDESQGADGFASIEVFPGLARDAKGTLVQARMLWQRLQCPNVMIKVPSTPECIGVIRALLAEGINVNITLMFGFESYRDVAEAFLTALEDRAAAGQPVNTAASVASLFVSRVDVKVDAELDRMAAANPGRAESLRALRGQAAIANARRMYGHFLQTFSGPRWEKLRALGARPQRLLWASTSTKNPAYPDTYYADALVGPDTVDTMPDATVAAFRDHGHPADRLSTATRASEPVLAALAATGLRLDDILLDLQNEGVDLFEKSFVELIGNVRSKSEALQRELTGSRASAGLHLAGPRALLAQAEAAATALGERQAGTRIWRKDASFWGGDAGLDAVVENRLGWLDLAPAMLPDAAAITGFARQCRADGLKHVVLLGMGGSSLAPEVMAQVFAPEMRQAGMNLTVLDTTNPDTVAAVAAALKPAETLFLVSSKSGGTIEPNSLFAIFWDQMQRALPAAQVGSHFIAITDPGTSLELLGAEHGFRRVFLNPPDIGGRYSALSYFGLVPAALIGVDIEELLRRAAVMAGACAAAVPAATHPAILLGAALGAWAHGKRDKLTFVTSPSLAGMGAWLEQLVAESTGKQSKGIVPVAREPIAGPAVYGADRIFCHLRLEGEEAADAPLRALAETTPVVTLDLNDRYDVGQEFFRWEFATAVAGAVLELDPFDEPNVQESKDNSLRVLDAFLRGGAQAAGFDRPPTAAAGRLRVWTQTPGPTPGAGLGEIVSAWLAQMGNGDYCALLAYLDRRPELIAALEGMRVFIRDRRRVATTLGFGPSYLHSSGQLHKGGPASGVFLLLTSEPAHDGPIPGRGYSLRTLLASQSMGDFTSLAAHGRRLLRIDLGADAAAGLDELQSLLGRQGSSQAAD